MGVEWVLIGLALVFGFYMAWNIGANDVANAMGTSVGSGALTLKWAIVVAAIFEFGGAFFVGSHVADTIRSGIFDPADIGDPIILAKGMIASLLAAGVWLQVASYFGWPVSTTHSIVGAVLGFGTVVLGPAAIDWWSVGKIASSWVISPLLAAAISLLLFQFLLRAIFYRSDPVAAAKRIAPWLIFGVVLVLVTVTSVKAFGPMWKSYGLAADSGAALSITAIIGAVGGIIGAIVAMVLLRHIEDEPDAGGDRFQIVTVRRSFDKAIKHLRRVERSSTGDTRRRAQDLLAEVQQLSSAAERQAPAVSDSASRKVERIFIYLQITSACFVAFAHGANDVANAIGPLSAAVEALQHGVIAAKATVPNWALLLGGVGIVVGLATWGWRVMDTIGRRITELTPSRGFTAEFSAATTILVASFLGLPVSTTHCLVGAILGVGLARGIGAINLNTVRDIVASWIITIPAGAGLAIVFYYILRLIFG